MRNFRHKMLYWITVQTSQGNAKTIHFLFKKKWKVLPIMDIYITKEIGICYAVEHFVKTDSQPMLYGITSNLEQFYGVFILIRYQTGCYSITETIKPLCSLVHYVVKSWVICDIWHMLILSGDSGFLPQCQDMQVRLIGHSNGWWMAARPMLAGIGCWVPPWYLLMVHLCL